MIITWNCRDKTDRSNTRRKLVTPIRSLTIPGCQYSKKYFSDPPDCDWLLFFIVSALSRSPFTPVVEETKLNVK